MPLILYGTENCHLCEEAESIMRDLSLQWESIDIAEDEHLLTRYGNSIPVLLRRDNCQSISWPFTPMDVVRLLQD